MATIQDRWHRKNRETGKLERTALYGKGKRYRPHFRDPSGREVAVWVDDNHASGTYVRTMQPWVERRIAPLVEQALRRD